MASRDVGEHTVKLNNAFSIHYIYTTVCKRFYKLVVCNMN
jgi:hypothetical protein